MSLSDIFTTIKNIMGIFMTKHIVQYSILYIILNIVSKIKLVGPLVAPIKWTLRQT